MKVFKSNYLLIFSLALIFFGAATGQIRQKRLITKDRSHLAKGVEYFNKGQLDKARSEFRRALVNDPKNATVYGYLADIAYRKKELKLAEELAKKAVQIRENTYRALGVLGLIELERGNSVQARSYLKKAVQFCDNGRDKERLRSAISRIATSVDQSYQLPDTGHEEPVPTVQSSPGGTTVLLPRIAVFSFEDATLLTERAGLGQSISEMITTALISSGSFEVIERLQLETVIKEQSLGQSGVIDSEDAVKVGKILGVEAVMIGSLSKLRKVIEGDARLIEVETGKAIAAASASVARVDDLRELANDLAQKMSQKAYLIKRKTKVAPDSISSSANEGDR